MTAGPRILVAHASAAGSTVGIAERIADTLRRGGCEVVCRPAGAAVNPRAFDGLVLGSAVHDMAWLPPALAMLREVAEPPGHRLFYRALGGRTGDHRNWPAIEGWSDAILAELTR
jgi:hypothetical protein